MHSLIDRYTIIIFMNSLSYGNCRAALFKEAGEVIEVRLARWKLLKDNNSKGFCHVEFATEEAAKRVI